MRKNKLKLKHCGKMLLTVILMSSLMTFPMFAEQPMGQPPNLNGNEMRLYSDSKVNYPAELDLLIDEISEAALQAIEQAAGEAAKAAVLSVLERETAALKEAAHQQAEALKWRIQSEINAMTIKETKKKGIKNAFIAGAVCLFSGLVIGIGGTIYLGGK